MNFEYLAKTWLDRADRIDQEAKLKDYRERWWMEREARTIRILRGEMLEAASHLSNSESNTATLSPKKQQ